MFEVHSRIEIVSGDITKLQVDAIVNAANTSLLGGGGVDGAIHRAAGPELAMECRMLRGCKPGEAKVTGGYKLPTRWVIHTVGPVWFGGTNKEDEVLASCYRNALDLAREKVALTVAFPAIGTGIYRFPVLRAADIAVREVTDFLTENGIPEQVLFVCFDEPKLDAYEAALAWQLTQ